MRFCPSYHLAGAFPLPLDMGYIFLVGSNILLSMVVQQQVVTLEFSQEKMSEQPSTPPSCDRIMVFQSKVQFSSFTQLCPTLCDPMNRSTAGLPVHHHLLEFTQTHVQPSHSWSPPSPPAPNPSQHQSLFQWVNSSPEVAKVLQFQL